MIAYSGFTGKALAGLLHFEIRDNQKNYLDLREFFPGLTEGDVIAKQ